MKTFNRLLLALALMLCLQACRNRPEAPSAPDPNILCSELKSTDKLVLARMTISKMAAIDDIRFRDAHGARQKFDAIINKLKLGDRKAVYSYNTYLQAYIDLTYFSPSDISVSESARTITINLPAVATEFAGRDAELREEHYRVTGLRSKIKADERANIKELMNESLRSEVESRPEFHNRIAATARGKAAAYFSAIAARPGYTVTINFK